MRSRTVITALTAVTILFCGCAPKATTSLPQPGATPDNSANPLDWDGTYSGVVPCADCEGIETSITLGRDLSYLVKTRYLGKDDKVFEREGAFTWNEEGNAVTLKGNADGPDRYLVGENVLIQLDKQGNRITGDLAAKYVLRKTTDAATSAPEALFTPAKWRLTELRGQAVARLDDSTKEPSLTFVKEGSKVHGFAGCNSFAGQAELLAGNRLRIKNVASTLKACLDPTVETEFLKVLETADNYSLNGQVLKLNKAKMAPLARFEAIDRE
jgi:heat shock protein HslJ